MFSNFRNLLLFAILTPQVPMDLGHPREERMVEVARVRTIPSHPSVRMEDKQHRCHL